MIICKQFFGAVLDHVFTYYTQVLHTAYCYDKVMEKSVAVKTVIVLEKCIFVILSSALYTVRLQYIISDGADLHLVLVGGQNEKQTLNHPKFSTFTASLE